REVERILSRSNHRLDHVWFVGPDPDVFPMASHGDCERRAPAACTDNCDCGIHAADLEWSAPCASRCPPSKGGHYEPAKPAGGCLHRPSTIKTLSVFRIPRPRFSACF